MRHRRLEVDMSATVGSVRLPNPVMTASGTAGYGTELDRYLDYSQLGAVVVKSLAAYEWAGNPAPRVFPTAAGMINSVGLQGPGVHRWLSEQLPGLVDAGARVVVSVWGRSVEDYAEVAAALGRSELAVGGGLVAVEVNVSCPNLEDGGRMFSQSADMTKAVLSATEGCGLPRWAKLSAMVGDLVEVAAAAVEGGAEALTLINTLTGMVIDTEAKKPVLGGGGGGLSGRAIGPVAVRAVYDVYSAMGDVPIVGVGGIASGADAVEMLMAGASSVQVGTASFADPRAPAKVLDELRRWCAAHGVTRVGDLTGAAHG